MATKQNGQVLILKINSSRLKKNGWNINITPYEARRNEELIALSESDILRYIDSMNGNTDTKDRIKELKREIKQTRKMTNAYEAKNLIKGLYKELDTVQFKTDYMCLISDTVKDFRYACKRGFIINGECYRRLVGTSGGVKSSTVVFVRETILEELNRRIDNGRDLTKPIVPAKLEAYRGLVCSSSTPVSYPKGLLVVKDVITCFKDKVILLDDKDSDEPTSTIIDDYEVNLNVSDGCGMVRPDLAEQWALDLKLDYLPAGFCTRCSWEKGMTFTFDFVDFAEKVARSYTVVDVWGNEHDIRDIDLVLTESMLKLWDSYSSVDDYLENCYKNKYTFSITKVTPEELEKERNLNYQFLQSFYLTDEEIDELIKPTIDEIRDVLGNDYRKSILFLKGIQLNESNVEYSDNDYMKALMIDKRMIEDPFVKSKIHFMIKKKINNAKTGVVKVHGNFSIVSGDLYALCQSMFGMEVTGLLNAHEIHNEYWRVKDTEQVVVFRAPMTSHNNILKMDVVDRDEVSYWYRFMPTVTILNSFDTACDALNGCDKDGDMVLLTDNNVLLRNVRDTFTIVCAQRKAEKRVAIESDLIQANISSFGDEIGSTTNKITIMYEVQSKYPIGSKEHDVLDYRISCGQLFQQNAIDKTKGIISKPMPKAWYDFGVNKYDEETTFDEEIEKRKFNISILANKKPYFMCYIYPQLMNDYQNHLSKAKKACIMRFGVKLEVLQQKKNKNSEELEFLNYYEDSFPVGMNPCIINKIAWKFEKEFDGYLQNYKNTFTFDHSILKSNINYKRTMAVNVGVIYEAYKKRMSLLAIKAKKDRMSAGNISTGRYQIKTYFKQECECLCPNEEILADIVIDACYTNNNSKQFAWDICGGYIVANMLARNNQTIYYPENDEKNPEFYYCGNGYSMRKYDIKKENQTWF